MKKENTNREQLSTNNLQLTIIKKGWVVKKLGEVCDFQNGFAFKSKTYKNEGIPVVRITNIQDEEIDLSKIVYINPKDYNKDLSKYKIVKGDLLIAMSGATTGKIGIHKTDEILLLNQRVGKFKPKEDLNKAYLLNYLKTKVEESLAISAGAAQPNLSTQQIKDFQIPIPPLIQQKQIVKILDQAFTAIDKAKNNAQQNLLNAKQLFESYLQNVFENNNWEGKTLEQIADVFGRGKSKHRPRNDKKLFGGNYPFIQTGDIRNSEHFVTNYSQTYNEVGLAQSKLWPKGTICITIAANIAETGILTFDACFPDSVIGIVVNKELANIDFVEYLLQSFKVNLQALSKGSAQDNINLGTFKNKLFPFPSVKEQQKIVKKLNDLQAETKKLEIIYQQKIVDLEELKKSILQKAFSGALTN